MDPKPDDELQAPAAKQVPNEGDETQTLGIPADDNEVFFDGVAVSDEPEGDEGTPLVKELRARHREQARRIRELESRGPSTPADPAAETLGEKPTAADFDFDTEAFGSALETWLAKKARIDASQAATAAAQTAAEQAWNAKVGAYRTQAQELRLRDFEAAEEAAAADLTVTQQAIVLQGATQPATVIYALGRNAAKRRELAAISDPVQFAFAIARLEANLKVASRKPTTAPEQVVTGNGRPSGSAITNAAQQAKLDKLAEQAAQSGNINAYRQQRRAQQQSTNGAAGRPR